MSDSTETPDTLSFAPVSFIAARLNGVPQDILNRHRKHRDTFTILLAEANSTHQVIQTLLRKQLSTEPSTTGLRFNTSNTFVSLAALAAYNRHHPRAPTDLDTRAQVVGTEAQSPLLRLTPTQLLARLGELDLPAAIRQAWNSYWNARAKGTPVSRQTHAQDQYLGIFRARWEAVVASGELDTQQQRLVSGVLNDPEWLRLGSKQLFIETPAIAGKAIPGALVFSIEDTPLRVLYIPGSQQTFTAHATGQALEAALLHNSSTSDATAIVSFHRQDSLAAGFTTLFNDLLQVRLDALAFDPGADIQTHAELALGKLHAVDAAQRNANLFHALPATEPELDSDASEASFFDFGHLSIEVPYSVRAEQIKKQMNLLDALDEEKLQSLKTWQATLEGARSKADLAMEPLLQANAWLSFNASQTDDDPPLLSAHHEGLRAHAQIQNLLGQIDDEERRWIESVLDQPSSFPKPGSDIIAAHPELSETTQRDGTESTTRTLISDCVIITLKNQQAPTSLLLFWPGAMGGLLRLANQAELERCLGVVDPGSQSVTLVPLAGDILGQVLTHHLLRSKAAAQRLSPMADSTVGDQALSHLGEALAHSLRVPGHGARELALRLLEEQRATVTLSSLSMPWLENLTDAERSAFKSSAQDYLQAMRSAQALIARDLPNRPLFCRQYIRQRLKQDIPTYDDSEISIDLPHSTSWRKDPVSGGGTPGGVPSKSDLVASPARQTLTLDNLFLENIDTAMKNRLYFMTLQPSSTDPVIAQALNSTIDKTYLEDLAEDLDLAQKYEDRILATYRGTNESEFARAFRRECLTEPFRQMLKMHSVHARANGNLDAHGKVIFDIAIDAGHTDDYQVSGHDIRLIPARLTVGGQDTNDGPTTLSGVTFINDQTSGITVLYCPDHPSKLIRQFSSLESAREALYESTKQSGEIDYLTSRALQGDPTSHASRMRQAIEKRFSGIIGLGSAWLSNISLAQTLLNAQEGRVLEAHRLTSRSNETLWLENFAYQSGMIFNYIKMAIGFVPLIGTAVSVYDMFDACARAASALVHGQVGRAMDELEQALLCFIDAAMDVLPTLVVKGSAARRLTRFRQLNSLQGGQGTGPKSSTASASKRLARFAGYEYPFPLDLQDLRPAKQGKYRGVYRHAEGDFILVEDRLCQVEWLETEHTWRLRGTSRKTWKRNIALNEQGQWDTHFALYGVHLHGGGSGGGQALGHLAEQLDPYWPAAIRQRLPRFWTDRLYRRQHMLKARGLQDENRLQTSLQRSNASFIAYDAAAPAAQVALRTQMKANCLADIDAAKNAFTSWDELLKIANRTDKQLCMLQKVRSAKVVCDRLHHLIELARDESLGSVHKAVNLRLQLAQVDDLVDQAPLLRRLRSESVTVLQAKSQMAAHKLQLVDWYKALDFPAPRPGRRAADFNQRLNSIKSDFTERLKAAEHIQDADNYQTAVAEANQQFENRLTRLGDNFDINAEYLQEFARHEIFKHAYQRLEKRLNNTLFILFNTLHLMVAAKHYGNTSVIAEFYLRRLNAIEEDVAQVQGTLADMYEVTTSSEQRRAIQDSALRVYRQYKLELQSTHASFPELFDGHYLKQLHENLDELLLQTEKYIRRLPGQPRPSRGRSSPRLFQVEDGNFYIGDFTPATGSAPARITAHNPDGGAVRQFEPVGERWRPLITPPPARPHELRNLKQTAAALLKDLDSFRRNVHTSIKPTSSPYQLNDMMTIKANSLESCANRIEALGGTLTDTADLRQQATLLRQEGTALLVAQIKASQQPNAGYLVDLLTHGQIRIQRPNNRQLLRTRDYLQEYEVVDLKSAGEPVLWYAHFHYRDLDTPFERFSAAHLKRVEDRFKGPQWQQTQTGGGNPPDDIWRGVIRAEVANQYFADL
ncbi:dermonecrotic toxin domain-containing protein [Pseudomonas sp. BJa5]|uniref:dermonecrotic toxin domain-containing protein n=1 Tax=Pseudomonas sp. BJa5 TaxID=2936270 RepID=UPI0025595184|nr:DUF6543 domain-containing protein [Pseudomonas sp. BGr12]MDL2423508.1 hypothetical protein [Pseudomonas sp. BGr12]